MKNLRIEYQFGRGDGKDEILAEMVAQHNAIRMKAGVKPGDLIISKDFLSGETVDGYGYINHRLKIGLKNTDDQLIVNGYGQDGDSIRSVDRIEFEDGTIWDRGDIDRLLSAGTASDDKVNGTSADDVIDGLGGNDTIYGGSGNDEINGGAGNDYLGGGRSIIWSFSSYDGNDTIRGGTGNDNYLFSGGQDIIEETSGDRDWLTFDSDIRPEHLWLSRHGQDLEILYYEKGATTTIKDWYSSHNKQIENIRTWRGKSLDVANVDNLVNAMAAFDPPAAGQSSLPDNYQEALAPVIAANWT